jgi:hypothetical protein
MVQVEEETRERKDCDSARLCTKVCSFWRRALSFLSAILVDTPFFDRRGRAAQREEQMKKKNLEEGWQMRGE